MKRGFRKGFTLIELLIVLAVIAALLAVVTPVALNAVRKANLTKIASNLRNIKTAAETYVTVNYENLSEEDIDVGKLHESGYLTTDPNKGLDNTEYFAALTRDEETGNITVTIWYTGEGIDDEDLQPIYSEVKEVDAPDGSGKYPGVEFTMGNW